MPSLDLSILLPYLPEFIAGLKATLYYSFASIGLAILFGLIAAFARMSNSFLLRALARAYIDITRGVPALVIIFFIYFGAPAIGIQLGSDVAGILALALNSGGYLAEIFRAGIVSIDPGQHEAGRCIGMSHAQTMRRIILPQAARLVIPSFAGEFTNLIKSTSLLSTIAITELTRVAQQVVSVSFRPLEAYIAIAVAYYIVNVIVSEGCLRIEKSLRKSQGITA